MNGLYTILDAVREAAVPFEENSPNLDAILETIGDAHYVLLGEASHGTHEFYQIRAEITKRLIQEKGFTLVAVEADWPDAYRVNRYVRGMGDDENAIEALDNFKRFPTWMWRNVDVVDFVEWLQSWNAEHAGDVEEPHAGFYGLDLYSLYTSIEAVLTFLQDVDPEAARRARERYSCFDHYERDSQMYGYSAGRGRDDCEDEVIAQLVELQQRAADIVKRDGSLPPDEVFFAEQNARLVKNAEEYYREMYRGRRSSWNLRDTHMSETMENLVTHFEEKHGEKPKIVVWEHNSHLGDARATEMGRRGELNVGRLTREKNGDDSRLIGFTTHAGFVTAADHWDGPARRKRIRPALEGSYERLFHQTNLRNFFLDLRKASPAQEHLQQQLLERAIGVIYRPETERQSHYFFASLAKQFDAVIHLEETHAVQPLERTPQWDRGEAPETFPRGL